MQTCVLHSLCVYNSVKVFGRGAGEPFYQKCLPEKERAQTYVLHSLCVYKSVKVFGRGAGEPFYQKGSPAKNSIKVYSVKIGVSAGSEDL